LCWRLFPEVVCRMRRAKNPSGPPAADNPVKLLKKVGSEPRSSSQNDIRLKEGRGRCVFPAERERGKRARKRKRFFPIVDWSISQIEEDVKAIAVHKGEVFIAGREGAASSLDFVTGQRR
jgi:hypothetical protein